MSEHLSIRQWPEQERPRERLLQFGVSALSDAELLALLFRSGSRGRSAVDLARESLLKSGGLRGLARASLGELPRGLGPVRWASVQAAMEIGRRMAGQDLVRGAAIADPAAVRHALQMRLRDLRHEVFQALFLDARHQILAIEEMFRGNANGAAVYVGEVVRRALHWGASAMIVAHNHPSGIAEASAQDRMLTQQLAKALQLVEIRLLDHVIVGEGATYSFAERGEL
jgi:DNA repair protein RadC